MSQLVERHLLLMSIEMLFFIAIMTFCLRRPGRSPPSSQGQTLIIDPFEYRNHHSPPTSLKPHASAPRLNGVAGTVAHQQRRSSADQPLFGGTAIDSLSADNLSGFRSGMMANINLEYDLKLYKFVCNSYKPFGSHHAFIKVLCFHN